MSLAGSRRLEHKKTKETKGGSMEPAGLNSVSREDAKTQRENRKVRDSESTDVMPLVLDQRGERANLQNELEDAASMVDALNHGSH